MIHDYDLISEYFDVVGQLEDLQTSESGNSFESDQLQDRLRDIWGSMSLEDKNYITGSSSDEF